jgi:2-methylcitrate dehydratase PrpD
MNRSAEPEQITVESTSASLARFALDLTYDSLPADIIELAKGHFLDVLGISLASTRFDFGKAVLGAARELGEGNAATALGSGARLPIPSAALVNGTLAHGLDFDDTHIAAVYHASAPALAAALAAGEGVGADGRDVLLAFVAALEIGCRLAAAGEADFHDRGFHPTALCGTFAAAAAAGKLRGLAPPSLVSSLGLCGSQAAGILELRESWLKRFHPGWAAHAGLVAVALGANGFRGPATVFEGSHGFYAAHIGRIPEGEKVPAHGLGEIWLTRGLALKPYPCCHFIHAFVDAALFLRDQAPLADIERIDCPLSARLHPMIAEPRERFVRPRTIYDALFSVPYIVALTLVRGRVDLAAFYDEPLDDPEVLGLAARTFCEDDPESDYPDHFPGELRITLRDGSVLQRREPASSGTPERRLTRRQINEKFRLNAARAIGDDQVARVIDAVWDFENIGDIGNLVALCISGSGE